MQIGYTIEFLVNAPSSCKDTAVIVAKMHRHKSPIYTVTGLKTYVGMHKVTWNTLHCNFMVMPIS